mmetsp:Transcript_71048/g.205998  ORF Transcript_71048/g.205998 Transcript_71048/m.205998 type:complete len:202 (+) Transcript_71048:211-816(+)
MGVRGMGASGSPCKVGHDPPAARPMLGLCAHVVGVVARARQAHVAGLPPHCRAGCIPRPAHSRRLPCWCRPLRCHGPLPFRVGGRARGHYRSEPAGDWSAAALRQCLCAAAELVRGAGGARGVTQRSRCRPVRRCHLRAPRCARDRTRRQRCLAPWWHPRVRVKVWESGVVRVLGGHRGPWVCFEERGAAEERTPRPGPRR